MLIIIEGVDCSGKSTLTQQLADTIAVTRDVTQFHRGVPAEHVLREYEDPLYDYCPGTNSSVVCDRWQIGPDVYGPVKRGDSGLDPVIRWHIDNWLIAKGAMLVYTEMPLAPLLERMRSRGEDYLKEDEVETIINYYRDAIKKVALATVVSLTGVHDALNIISKAMQVEQGSLQSGSIKSYVGLRRPTEVFVGESPTGIAFQPYEGTHSYDIIYKYGYASTYAAGFMDVSDITNASWDALYNPLVYALDDAALHACQIANVPAQPVKEWK